LIFFDETLYEMNIHRFIFGKGLVEITFTK